MVYCVSEKTAEDYTDDQSNNHAAIMSGNRMSFQHLQCLI